MAAESGEGPQEMMEGESSLGAGTAAAAEGVGAARRRGAATQRGGCQLRAAGLWASRGREAAFCPSRGRLPAGSGAGPRAVGAVFVSPEAWRDAFPLPEGGPREGLCGDDPDTKNKDDKKEIPWQLRCFSSAAP